MRPYWWGYQISIDSYTADLLAIAVGTGAGVATVGTVLAGAGIVTSAAALPLGIASGLLTIGAGVISFQNTRSKGKGIYWQLPKSIVPLIRK